MARFIFLIFISASSVFASVKKIVEIDGQQYSCRPSHIEPACNLSTDLALKFSLAADSADASLCLKDAGNEAAKVENCFLQPRIKQYAKDLDVQLVGAACWKTFFKICTENEVCSSDPQKRCGHLGSFLHEVKRVGLSHLFSEADGIKLCRALAEQ